MKKVWILTEGSYSDYHIVAVFETEEEAKAYTNGAEADDSSDYQIEPWETGPPGPNTLQMVYRCCLNLDGSNFYEIIGFEEVPRDYSEATPGVHSVGKSVTGPEHAYKLAVEARQSWITEHPI